MEKAAQKYGSATGAYVLRPPMTADGDKYTELTKTGQRGQCFGDNRLDRRLVGLPRAVNEVSRAAPSAIAGLR